MTDDLHHLAAAYALDALDPAERALFEAHYPGCATCSEDVAAFREIASLLTATPVDPPAHVRGNVMAQIAQTPQLSALSAPASPAPTAGSPTLSTSVATAVVPSATGTSDDNTVIDLSTRRRRVARVALGAVAAVSLLVAGVVGFAIGDGGPTGTNQEIAALIASPDVSVRALEGIPEGAISVAWSPSQGDLAVFGSGLGDPGNGLVYALWMLDSNGATPSILFTPDDGLVEAFGALPGDPDGWGITVEPAGGSPQPTGEVIFVGEV